MLKMMLAPLKWAVRFVLALVILFEEWGWDPLQRAMARIGQLPVFRHLEAAVRRLSPYLALAVLLVPSLFLVPVKLLALWLISLGHTGVGLSVIVLAKVVGTAVVARLFALTQPALMRLAWFRRVYARWTEWKAGLLAWVRASAVWRTARALKLRLRRLLRRSEARRAQ
ncbi:hypothetical protein SAMN05216359_103295 [Roseateles sp. YR242]|uniref:hypothetical protein n=1 Tax=Roseateles sp. YR242 TaxID=1855305 RepID=UPI0008B43328|nr:hypothetical protein [Roseateles sp. YR242]SEK84160.1 hypothetical protein SAMN05216359_103295 [Roseateles sp. YR242]